MPYRNTASVVSGLFVPTFALCCIGYEPGAAFIFASICLSTAPRIWSMLKLAGFWLGGYSTKVWRNLADLVTATATK